MKPIRSSSLLRAALLGAAALAAGCAGLAPGGLPPGTSIDVARQQLFKPTAEYALPGGGTRLEFMHGGLARRTDMLDFDPGGKLVASQQVLTEANLAGIKPGLSSADVLMRIGHPIHVFGVSWQKLHVWNYRFAGGDCFWFQVSISDATGLVTDAGNGPDPVCEGPRDRK